MVYRHLFGPPGAASFVAAGFIARLTVSMSSLGLVLAVSAHESRGYAKAGLLVAVFGLASSLPGPFIGRLMDQHGQRAILLPLVSVFTVSMVVITGAIASHAPVLVLLPLAAVSGASMPVCGPLIRTRWTKIYGGTPMLRVSYAFESVTDEIVYIVGPVTIAAVATAFGVSAGLLLVAACAAGGTVALALQARTQPEPNKEQMARRSLVALLTGSVPLQVVCAALFGIGGALGSLEIITIAYTGLYHDKGISGVLLGLMSLASMIAGLVFGAMRTEFGPARQLGTIVAFGCVLTSLLLVHGLAVLAVVLFCVGLFLAPAMITCLGTVQRVVRQSALTEAMTWASAGIGLGLAAGGYVGGALTDLWSPAVAWLAPTGFGLAAALLVVAAYRPMARALR